MFMKKKVIDHFKFKDGKLDTSKPVMVDYSREEKLHYYENRLKNKKNLSHKQIFFAEKKIQMLKSGVGLIALTEDENFKGKNKSLRRVMISGVNEKGEKMVNRITSEASDKRMILRRFQVPILQKKSYLDQQVYIKKKNGGPYTDKDLIETSSTINPFDRNRAMHFIFSGLRNDKDTLKTAENNIRIGKSFKVKDY